MASDTNRAGAGVLVAIGGAEDKLGHRTILHQFVQLAGGRRARIAVIATASSLGDEILGLYRRVFTDLGAAEVMGLRPATREEAEGPGPAETVARATGVFMTGGNQLRLSMVVAGTRLGSALVDAHRRGAVVGGTSAGASALSAHMVAFGGPGEVPKQRLAHMSAGLGLLPGVVIDQHFSQRNRLGRLLLLVAESPSQLGIEVRARRPVLVSGVVLHALPPGYRFDLRARVLLPRLQAIATPGRQARQEVAEEWPARRPARRRRARGGEEQEASE
jgi:cyanophycinase